MLPTLYFTEVKPDLFRTLRTTCDNVEIRLLEPSGPDGMAGAPGWYFVDWLTREYAGIEICRTLRETEKIRSCYITMIFDPRDVSQDNMRRALQAGADSYLVAPVTLDKIAHRLNVLAGKVVTDGEAEILQCEKLVVDLKAMSARYDGCLLQVSAFEFRLLTLFMRKQDVVIARRELIGLVGKNSDEIDEKTVDVWVGRIRKAFKKAGAPDFIRTVNSVGYSFDGKISRAERALA